MAFIIRKKSKNKTLHYLVESIRVGGRSKHRSILTMGEHQTLDSLLASIEERTRKVQEDKQFYEECLRHVEGGLQPQRKEHTWSMEYLRTIIGYKEQNLVDLQKRHKHIKGLKEKYLPKISSGNSKS